MSAEDERRTDNVLILARVAGLDLPEGEMARLAALFERFSADRARLAATNAGENEPATIFQAPRTDDRS